MYYYKFKEPLARSISIEITKLRPPEVSVLNWNNIFNEMGYYPKWIHIVPDIFSYFYGTAKEDKTKGICLLVFYNTVVWQALVGLHKSTKPQE